MRRKDGNGLSTRETLITDPLLHFKSKVGLMLADVKNSPLPQKPVSIVLEQSSLEIANIASSLKDDQKIQSIIFSPPYANSFDYFRVLQIRIVDGQFHV